MTHILSGMCCRILMFTRLLFRSLGIIYMPQTWRDLTLY